MSHPPPGDLSLSTFASLLALRHAAASRRAAPVTHRGGAVTFSAAGVTGDDEVKTVAYASPVTPARMLPVRDGVSDEWEERAAILEHDGGWPRAMAEAIAIRLLSLDHRDSTAEAMRALDRELIEAERDLRPGPSGGRAGLRVGRARGAVRSASA